MVINDQQITFGHEYNQLENGMDVDRNSAIYCLSPFMDNNVIKMRTRLGHSELLPEQHKYPIILSKDSRLSELIILNSHEKQHHAGPEQTKRLVRNIYWILDGKRAISSILSKCPHQECVSKRLKPIIQAPPFITC